MRGRPLAVERDERVLDVELREPLAEGAVGDRSVAADQRRHGAPAGGTGERRTCARQFLALTREHRHRDAPSVVHLAEPERVVGARVVEEHLVERSVARDVPQRTHGDAGLVHRHEERGDPLVLRTLRVGAGEQQSVRRLVGEARPHLLAREGPDVAVTHRSRRQRGDVGARPRLGEELAPDLLVPGDRAEEALLVRFGAEGEERGTHLAHTDGVGEAGHLVAVERPRHRCDLRSLESPAAVLLGPSGGHVARVSERDPPPLEVVDVELLASDREGVGVFAVDCADPVGREMGTEKRLDLGLDRLDVAGVAHDPSSPTYHSGGRFSANARAPSRMSG